MASVDPAIAGNAPVPRGLTFPENVKDAEKVTRPIKPGGPDVSLKRELTQEDKGLAAAGYESLKQDDKNEKLDHADVTEHQLNFAELADALKTSFDTKDPANSTGLTDAEVKIRLARDGPNQLTPPKKKSALRVVCIANCHISSISCSFHGIVL